MQKIHVDVDMITKQLIREVERVTERLVTNKGQCVACIGCIEESNCKVECGAIDDCLNKLAEYENAYEEGRLIVLPCKVGDSLFCFSRGNIYTFKVRCIRIYEKRTEIELWYEGSDESYKFWHITIDEQDIGYKFFFTYEEADKVWKETNNE